MSIVLTFLLFGLVLLLPTAYAGFIGAPYAPTRRGIIAKAFERLQIDQDDVVVDLGAGDGKVLLAAAHRGARVIGYELSPIMWVVTRLRTWRLPRNICTILWRNFYTQTLPADTTIIFVFMMPQHMAKIRHFIHDQELSKLQFVLSYSFPIPDIRPVDLVQLERAGTIYVYGAESLAGPE